MEKKEFDFFELLRVILQNRKFIIIFVAVVSVAAIVYSLVTPKIWESRATFYVVGDEASALPFNIEGLGSLTAGLLGADNAQNAVNAVSALKSRRFSEDVIRHFNLIRYFETSDPDTLLAMDRALKKLNRKTVRVSHSSETGLVSIRVESKDKKLSKNMVDYYLLKLDEYNRTQKLTKGRMNREFLEARVHETNAAVDSLLIAIREFQQRNNAIDIATQTSALIDSYSEVIASKMQTDIELELALKNYASSSPVVEELRSRSNALARQIRDLEAGSGSLKPRYLIDISSLPDLGSQYAQLQMNFEIQKLVYQYLYPQYEAARLEELKDMPSLDILDSPREAGLRLRPRRAVICIVAFVLAFISAVVIVLIKNVFTSNKERLREIGK